MLAAWGVGIGLVAAFKGNDHPGIGLVTSSTRAGGSVGTQGPDQGQPPPTDRASATASGTQAPDATGAPALTADPSGSPAATPTRTPVRATATAPAPSPTRSPTPTAARTVAGTVSPGALCTDYWAYGWTRSGQLMRCTTTETDSRFRWRR